MRLWHSKLIPILDGRRLCDLHMSCCNLRGNGWGKRNAAVGYLYDDPLGEDALTVYHHLVLTEMDRRGYNFDIKWCVPQYCGKNRPERICYPERYKEARQRNVPLEGHTEELFVKDLDTLLERGLDLDYLHTIKTDADGRIYSIYVVANGSIEIKYVVTY